MKVPDTASSVIKSANFEGDMFARKYGLGFAFLCAAQVSSMSAQAETYTQYCFKEVAAPTAVNVTAYASYAVAGSTGAITGLVCYSTNNPTVPTDFQACVQVAGSAVTSGGYTQFAVKGAGTEQNVLQNIRDAVNGTPETTPPLYNTISAITWNNSTNTGSRSDAFSTIETSPNPGATAWAAAGSAATKISCKLIPAVMGKKK